MIWYHISNFYFIHTCVHSVAITLAFHSIGILCCLLLPPLDPALSYYFKVYNLPVDIGTMHHMIYTYI